MHHRFDYAWLIAIYPALHIGISVFVSNMPEPDSTKKTWYGAIYHTLHYFAVGNGPKTSNNPPANTSNSPQEKP